MLHKVDWNSEKIDSFWNNTNKLISKNIIDTTYFSEQKGEPILRKINKVVPLKGKRILDYGCGSGYLAKLICEKYNPDTVYGCDTSIESVNQTNQRCADNKNWGGAVLTKEDEIDLSENYFDIVLLTEVIEHLTDENLEFVFTQIKGKLKKNGIVVISTPNDENLGNSIVVCPDCGCYFHKVQHLRTWSAESLQKYMEEYGFKKMKVVKTNLREEKDLIHKIYSALFNWITPIFSRKPNNLIYFGQKIG